ncbi:MAG: phosphoenolpyruvate carboxykinase (ATP) [Candidatus Cardinium sp.]|nr:phosphoenolpyruvate carboxykinase (ATP) [Candidatus Cardinium sp.]
MSSRPIHYMDLSVSELIAHALQRGEGVLAANGALSVTTGKRRGRSPKDKFIVKTDDIADKIAWGPVHQAIEISVFQSLWERAMAYLAPIDRFVAHLQLVAYPPYSLPITIISEYAWHTLFAYHLFVRPQNKQLQDSNAMWTIVSLPGLLTDPDRDGVASDAALVIHLTARKVLLCGHRYAGEIKKAMFSVLSYLLPEQAVLPMHCAANVGEGGDVALFFGLSGTGKTALSSDATRYLIGDDEHGWSNQAVFNCEGGCYAQCFNLSLDQEPVIGQAIRYGSIMENVQLDPNTLEPNYGDATLTQNSRAAYPIDFVTQRLHAQWINRSPESIIFLTCDLYGVLPPVARLTEAQAAYYFLSGYTALVGSTEIGQKQLIQATFSSCFGAPFLIRPVETYLHLFRERLKESGATVYLVNTGWTAGGYGAGGYRFPITLTRSIIHAIVNGMLKEATYDYLPGFNLAIPTALPTIDSDLLDPRKSWQDKLLYQNETQALITRFWENAARFAIEAAVQAAAPSLEG